jgi:hypothetical protein
LERNWFSREYYDSPMPFSIFFHGGYAIHGSYAIDRLGGPASHGCVRLHPHHAAILFDLVQQEGPDKTSIEITDQGRPPEGPPVPGRDSASLQGAYPPALPSRDTVGMGPGANPPVPPRDIAGAGPGAYPPASPRDIVGAGPGMYPPGMYPPVLRGNQPMPPRVSMPPQPPMQPAPPRRMMANMKPPAGLEAPPASGPPRIPSEASEPRSRTKLMEAPKVIMGPREGSSPQPAQSASSSSIKMLPASCWSGGASRWQWWASSSQGNQCKQ